jgi:hypothetical protein
LSRGIGTDATRLSGGIVDRGIVPRGGSRLKNLEKRLRKTGLPGDGGRLLSSVVRRSQMLSDFNR